MKRHCVWLIFFFAMQVLCAQETLRGEVSLDLEPVYGFAFDEKPEGLGRVLEKPLDYNEARRRAVLDACYFFGAMIYGWSFHYDIGEKARGIPEKLELTALGTVSVDDPKFEVTDIQFKDMSVYLWSDYRPDAAQKHRISMWKKGLRRGVQAAGYCALDFVPPSRSGGGEDGAPAGGEAWQEIRQAALEDAARAAIRAMLRGQERNRPKEANGFICLTAFPRFWLEKGQWAASGRFLVSAGEIIPFAAY